MSDPVTKCRAWDDGCVLPSARLGESRGLSVTNVTEGTQRGSQAIDGMEASIVAKSPIQLACSLEYCRSRSLSVTKIGVLESARTSSSKIIQQVIAIYGLRGAVSVEVVPRARGSRARKILALKSQAQFLNKIRAKQYLIMSADLSPEQFLFARPSARSGQKIVLCDSGVGSLDLWSHIALSSYHEQVSWARHSISYAESLSRLHPYSFRGFSDCEIELSSVMSSAIREVVGSERKGNSWELTDNSLDNLRGFSRDRGHRFGDVGWIIGDPSVEFGRQSLDVFRKWLHAVRAAIQDTNPHIAQLRYLPHPAEVNPQLKLDGFSFKVDINPAPVELRLAAGPQDPAVIVGRLSSALAFSSFISHSETLVASVGSDSDSPIGKLLGYIGVVDLA